MNHPTILLPNNKIMMTLSEEDLEKFGNGYVQLSSPTHIVVTDKKTVIKVLYSYIEWIQIRNVIDAFNEADSQPKFSVLMKKNVVSMPRRVPSPLSYSYSYLHYAPMTWLEAKSCLKELVTSIAHALREIHLLEIRHNDVKLDNICFRNNFSLCLIDFDRSSSNIGNAAVYFSGVNSSCMYNLSEPKYKPKKGSNIVTICSLVG